MTTVGGVVFRHLDRLPVAGDHVIVEGIHFHVLSMHELRINTVRVSRNPLPENEVGES